MTMVNRLVLVFNRLREIEQGVSEGGEQLRGLLLLEPALARVAKTILVMVR